MESSRSFVDLIRASSQLVARSAQLRIRAQETLHQSTVIMDRSRELLSTWRVNGVPDFGKTIYENAPVAVREASKHTAETRDPSPDAVLEIVPEQDFSGVVLRLDGRHFVDCKVENCILEYSGGPVVLEGTNFTGCRFQFGGEAAMTVAVLECFGLVEQQHAKPTLSPEAVRVN